MDQIESNIEYLILYWSLLIIENVDHKEIMEPYDVIHIFITIGSCLFIALGLGNPFVLGHAEKEYFSQCKY